MYKVCPENTVGLGVCSEPLNVYGPQDSTLIYNSPKLLGSDGSSGTLQFIDYNRARDAIAVAWDYKPSGRSYPSCSVYRGDFYAQEWSKTIDSGYYEDSVSAVRFNPSGLKLLIATDSQYIFLLHATNGTLIRSFKLG
jgi:WD40 repeat protein